MNVSTKLSILAAVTTLMLCSGVLGSEIENKLHNELFRTYNKYVRPVEYHNESVLIQFGLSLNQMLDVNEKDQSLSTHVWINQIWTDYRLTWNPDEYENIEYVIIPSIWLWYPDMVLDNSVHGSSDLPVSKFASVQFDGTVWITPPAALVSQCDIDIQYFPFDTQKCHLSFGPWEYTSELVRLLPIEKFVVKEKFLPNVEWELTNSTVRTLDEELECCPGETYSVVIYTLWFRRRPLQYLVTIFLPCVLLAVLTTLAFCVPPDYHEKISLSILVLLALLLVALLTADVVPPTSETTPLLYRYLVFNVVMVTVSLILSVAVLNIHRGSYRSKPVPMSIRRKLLYTLPRMLCMQEYEGEKKVRKVPRYRNSYTSYGYRYARGSSSRVRERLTKTQNGGEGNTSIGNGRPSISSVDGATLNKTSSQIDVTPFDDTATTCIGGSDEHREKQFWSEFEKCITSNLKFITDRIKDKDKELQVAAEWRYAARVVDRLFLVIFIVGEIVGIGMIILTAPGLINLHI